jgi:hypothetical protein
MKFFTIVLALALSACAPLQSRDGAVTLDAERVSPETVRLTLRNGSASAVGYNLCASVLEHETGTTWSQVRTDDVCTMELRTLAAGESATFDKRLPTDLPAGDYRYLTSVESPLGTAQSGIASDSFPVTR